jgi:hypothetical protein
MVGIRVRDEEVSIREIEARGMGARDYMELSRVLLWLLRFLKKAV